MDSELSEYLGNALVWFPEKEVGYYPVRTANKYNDAYFDNYAQYEGEEIGKCLNDFRVSLVNEYTSGLVLDIGIGSGTFMNRRGNCFGYDINPKAVSWLMERGMFFDPYMESLVSVKGITFFDSLEHIRYLSKILNKISNQFVFVSLPIFRDLQHLLKSKHFKKDEHYYYFTKTSFIEYMLFLDFVLLEIRDDEMKCGREDIYTFVFRKC
jgi:hypothetical protein